MKNLIEWIWFTQWHLQPWIEHKDIVSAIRKRKHFNEFMKPNAHFYPCLFIHKLYFSWIGQRKEFGWNIEQRHFIPNFLHIFFMTLVILFCYVKYKLILFFSSFIMDYSHHSYYTDRHIYNIHDSLSDQMNFGEPEAVWEKFHNYIQFKRYMIFYVFHENLKLQLFSNTWILQKLPGNEDEPMPTIHMWLVDSTGAFYSIAYINVALFLIPLIPQNRNFSSSI